MSGVDVLAVMDELAEDLFDERMATSANELEVVRAAVAELIEAMGTIHKNLYQLHVSGDAGRMVEDELEIAAAALRRVKGEIE